MVTQDMIVNYNTQKNRVLQQLRKVEDAQIDLVFKDGPNVKAIRQDIEKIIADCEKASTVDSNSLEVFNSGMATQMAAYPQQKAYDALLKKEIQLDELDKYVKVANLCQFLKSFLNDKNKKKEDFDKVRDQIFEALRLVKMSISGKTFEPEAVLYKEIYPLLYKFIKEEILYCGASETVKIVLSDPTDTYNIEEEIVRELDALDLNDSKYRGLVAKKMQIDMLGLQGSYVNEEFLKILVISTMDVTKVKGDLQKTTKLILKNDQQMENQIYSFENYKESSDINKKQKRKIKRRIFKRITAVFAAFGVACGLWTGHAFLAKKFTKVNTYGLNRSRYSIAEGYKTYPKEYVVKPENSTVVYEYQPYELNDNKKYERKIIAYDVSGMSDLSLEECIGLDFEALGIEGNEETVSVSYLAPWEENDEIVRFVERYEYNDTDIVETTPAFRVGWVNALLLLADVILLTVAEGVLNLWNKNKFFDLTFLYVLRDVRRLSNELKDLDKENEEYKKKAKELYDRIKMLWNQNREQLKKYDAIKELASKTAEMQNLIDSFDKEVAVARKREIPKN